MGSIDIEDKVDMLGPKPEESYLDSKVENANKPDAVSFDPAALKEKYRAERDKRLLKDGINQYRYVEGDLGRYQVDPWVEPGFDRERVDEDVEVAIIGGGYGAQLCAVRLIEAGITNVRIIEKAGDFGGTWYWNRYPGAQCDIESYIYMPLLEELNYMPTEKYAHADELLKHSQAIGKRWGLYEKALFQTEARSLRWDDHRSLWTVETSRGDNIRARFVIPCAGPLHRPKLPGLPVEFFQGYSFHSSRWDYAYTGGTTTGGLEKLADKRVAIIGTGATTVQIVPHLGADAKQVYVFQRTPSAINVRGNRPTDPTWAASLQPGWQLERMDNFNAIVNGGIEPEDHVNDGWTDILHKLLARGAARSADPAKAAADRQLVDFEKMEEIRARCDEIVKDKDTAEGLKPWYNNLCKRPCFHDEYLQAFNRPNVKLVDTQGKGVSDITERGVVANGEEFEVDCIIYATGFELATKWTQRANMEIYGRNGETISDKWSKGASTLHGWSTRGFPNCFFVSIVQAALTPNFSHVTGEQAKHLTYVIQACKERGIKTVEPYQAAEEKWVETILELAELRRKFLAECTPGYYNHEGTVRAEAAKNASYGGGSVAFIKILEAWRRADKLEGLDVKFVQEAAT